MCAQTAALRVFQDNNLKCWKLLHGFTHRRARLPAKETNLSFCFQQTNGSLPFPFLICRKQTEVAVFRLRKHGDIETWRHQTENGSPGVFPLSVLPFAHSANGSLSLVRLLTKKQTEVIRSQMD